jgi:hypothetical protein
MTYRIRRKFISSTFTVEGHLCKIFLEPVREYAPGYYLWNTGFAIGKSRRQLNDWYWRRKNKRRRSLDNHFNGRVGIKAIRRGFEEVLRLRWVLQPGDALVIDSTSGDPDKQFRAFSRWCRYHPEWCVDTIKQEFYWYRPPYADDVIRNEFEIIGITPDDPLANTMPDRYYDCFLIRPKDSSIHLPSQRIADLLALAQSMRPDV